jgi:putative radical SAM enzyme (TIGR03279 family)
MPGGLIAVVAANSLAERVGLQPGDELVSISGRVPRDVIDVRFYAAEEALKLEVQRDGQTFTVEAARRYDEPLGLEFVEPTFDGIRRCNNRCEFCFVTQMPSRGQYSPELRRSLYVKDDDYRYSFLFGSYITLTNLDEADWERLGEQHLSPLYVSVHTTDAELRRRVLGASASPDVMAQLHRLAELGIEVHTQIVVVPGLNDGIHLDRSICDLVELYPSVRSVSVVPVGLTRFHRGGCRTHTEDEMRAVLDRVTDWQEQLRPQINANFVYLSDEWYLGLDEEVPPLQAYDGLDLTENGVGLTRRFLDRHAETSDLKSTTSNITLVTGTLFAPVLRRVTEGRFANHPYVRVVPVVNRFFGETVTVAGLLTGQDVVAQLGGLDWDEIVALPPAMFAGPEGQSLDGEKPQDIAQALSCEVVMAHDLEEIR